MPLGLGFRRSAIMSAEGAFHTSLGQRSRDGMIR